MLAQSQRSPLLCLTPVYAMTRLTWYPLMACPSVLRSRVIVTLSLLKRNNTCTNSKVATLVLSARLCSDASHLVPSQGVSLCAKMSCDCYPLIA